MKLLYSVASPFARKVVIFAKELGLSDRVEAEFLSTKATEPNPRLAASNPVAKIPTLILDDGTPLYDSRVICAYLASLSDKVAMYPAGAERWRTMRLEATADGLMDAAVNNRYETDLRPVEKRWEEWSRAQMSKVEGALTEMNREAATFGDRVDAGIVASACACGYLDFRYPANGWRDRHPQLAAWYARFAERPSMRETRPEQ